MPSGTKNVSPARNVWRSTLVIGESDGAFQEMHQLVARKVDELAVIASRVPNADGKFTRGILEILMRVLGRNWRMQNIRRRRC